MLYLLHIKITINVIETMKNKTNQPNLFSKTWTKDTIWNTLSTNDDQLKKALLKLYEFQTSSEQAAQHTKYQNSVGFNGVDGKFLSNVAEFLKRNGYLSSKQIFRVRKSLRKYAGQLAKIANGELETSVEPININKLKMRGRRQPLGFSHWSRPRAEAPALNSDEIAYETNEAGNLYEHCRRESGGLTGKALDEYINRYYGHN